jgi:hypothetical protein
VTDTSTPADPAALSPLEAAAQQGGYFDMALDLRAAGLEKEKAAFAAWYTVPADKRVPRTLGEFAALVGISERTLRKWKFSDWWRDYQIDNVGMGILLEPLAEIDRATAEAALLEKGHVGIQARRQYYEELERRERRRKPLPDMTIDVSFNRALQRIYDEGPVIEGAGE